MSQIQPSVNNPSPDNGAVPKSNNANFDEVKKSNDGAVESAKQSSPVTKVAGSSAAEYNKWGPNAPTTSLNSIEARAIPVQDVSAKGSRRDSGVWPTKEEILEDIYLRQRAHGWSDSSSSTSHAAGDSGVPGSAQKSGHGFGRFASSQSIKRSGFYGACVSALILLLVFVVGLLVFMPMVLNNLSGLEDRLRKLEDAAKKRETDSKI